MLKSLKDLFTNRNRACSCGVLAKLAADPAVSLEFSEAASEYRLRIGGQGADLGYIPIYYCPFCGGRAITKRPSSCLREIPRAEKQRILKKTINLKTLDDFFVTFGPPDHDSRAGMLISPAIEGGAAEQTEVVRVLRYSNISTMANVVVCERPNGAVGITFEAKELPAM